MTVTIFLGVTAVVMLVLNFVFSFLSEKDMLRAGIDSYNGGIALSGILGLFFAFVFICSPALELSQDSGLDFLIRSGLMLLYIFAGFVEMYVAFELAWKYRHCD
ncbi:MAG: hypothetical protein J6A09_01780 [Alphaproteobacteria bacterium]|nr:hypothetical protein [Alphaproteobacteria bacterium]